MRWCWTETTVSPTHALALQQSYRRGSAFSFHHELLFANFRVFPWCVLVCVYITWTTNLYTPLLLYYGRIYKIRHKRPRRGATRCAATWRTCRRIASLCYCCWCGTEEELNKTTLINEQTFRETIRDGSIKR